MDCIDISQILFTLFWMHHLTKCKNLIWIDFLSIFSCPHIHACQTAVAAVTTTSNPHDGKRYGPARALQARIGWGTWLALCWKDDIESYQGICHVCFRFLWVQWCVEPFPWPFIIQDSYEHNIAWPLCHQHSLPWLKTNHQRPLQ